MDLPGQLMEEGYTVMTGDLPGIGELGPGYLKGDAFIQGVSLNQWFAGMLVNQSIAGLWATDMSAMLSLMDKLYPESAGETLLISKGVVTPATLHCAFMNQSSLKGLVNMNGLVTYADLGTTRNYKVEYMISAVPGALGHYDLPDILTGLSGIKVLLVNPMRADGSEAKDAFIDREIGATAGTGEAGQHLQIRKEQGENDVIDRILEWDAMD
jgi:hypothetical protein